MLNEENILKERKKEIQEELKKQGYTNKLINYKEFQELYRPYKNEMSEQDFAKILGIKYGNYMSMKNYGTKARILKEEIKVTEERKQEIQEELRKQGYTNKSIDYKEFQDIYELYKNEMSEQDFAEILGIKYSNYLNIRNQGTRARILKEEIKITEERKEEIQKELKKQGYTNKSIDYKEFQELYESYKNEMSEQDFAEVIGIKYGNYMNMKNQGTRARILKEEIKVTEERKEKIQKELKKQGYTNKSIDYKKFQEIYEPYKNEMSEQDFAEVIGIKYGNYKSMKNTVTRARILKEEIKIIEERKEEIQKELKKHGYTNKSIDYKEFQELYEPYKNEMNEQNFAEILGITYSNYMNVKNKGQRARILKEEIKVTEQRKQEIQEELRKQGYTNKLIDYKEFQELYEAYKNEMSEQDFTEILGIKYANYMTIKNSGQKAKIQFNKEKLDTIRYQIQSENREYKKEELEELCKKYNITLKDVLTSIFGQDKSVEKLINKDIIYIGKCELPREFSEKYAKQLLESANKLSKILTSKYRMKNIAEDIASETLIYILNNKGDIVKNSETDEEALSGIKRYMYISLKYKCVKNLTINKEISLDSEIGEENRFTGGRKIHEIIEDSKAEFEQKIESNLSESNEGDIVSRMKQCYEEGKNNTEAIETVIEEYGISKEELLEILRKELMKKKKIKKTKTGKVYLGEEIE